MEDKKVQLARYLLVQFIGLFFIILGILGLFLPILQGILFLCVGAVLIAMYNPPLHRHIHALVDKFPWLEDVFEKIEIFIERFFGPAPDGKNIRSGFPHHRAQSQQAEKKED